MQDRFSPDDADNRDVDIRKGIDGSAQKNYGADKNQHLRKNNNV